MKPDDEYQRWLNHRRAMPAVDLTDRIMVEIGATSKAERPIVRIGWVLLWTAASLIFVVRLAALVGNLAFPTDSYPEFAVDQQIENVPHDHRKATRS